ncbi:MAG TPA: ABC-F family ATP-binding cassette domain-containing protein [Vulgatibacter sp.]|nr:ABC-F family ATP-binding cassette domain-containing protein [Vulgatibacter sp.]
MTLLRAHSIGLSFGSRTLFDGLEFTIEEGERVGLVGVNGSGKSTLMKILAGVLPPDRGLLQVQRGAQVVYLPQEPTFPDGATVASELSVARPALREAIDEHRALSARIAVAPPAEQERLLAELGRVADRIERLGGWDSEFEARRLLDKLGVREWERPVAELSGGLRKRVAIARALLSRPDALLLDEPTNHLDADTVDWLEDALDELPGALLLVTHDRYFLDGLVDRIVEVEPGNGLVSYPGNYQAYLEQKMVALEQAELAQHKRERWIAQEVAWLRKGVEARRTKSKARIERARKLMAEKGFVRPKVAALEMASAPRLGGKVIEAEGIAKRFGDRTVFRDVDFLLQAGERVGIVGPNGVGKTTFLRTILGELEPDEGAVEIGRNTKIAYYDQQRASLDPEQTVYEAAWGEDHVLVGGRRLHLREYLEELLFPVPMQRMQVKALSGGERNRLLLARLFLEGANVLVLDEPTNDLDIVTLNVLERLLLSFEGSVLLVTHDRYFLDKVATAILAFGGDGRVTRYEGNYETYRTLERQAREACAPSPEVREEKAAPAPAPAPPPRRRRLGYLEKRELEGMEEAIERTERDKAATEAELQRPEVFSDPVRAAALHDELERQTALVDRLYARWQELQDLAD